jgi:tRNA threonylcarbamoyladenosine biosynthesis protein TsaE
MNFASESETDTDQLGRQIAEQVTPGTVISLNGPLGAGKTRLVKAIAAALGFDPSQVTSPTFVLVNEYFGGRMPIYHFDVYRLDDIDEFLGLGPDEYFEGDGVCLVEWGHRVADCLPADAWTVEIEIGEGSERGFRLILPNADARS